ncbi:MULTISPECIES: ABC transporter ATP-binding protein [unclassified Microbacterium]|uniref:ABC transporter ATP-binding protein n=1 Tax=unclassified Microbacterium TaxID=2609290 RepID=UPI000CFCE813|nr:MULTISPECIES: ABC transporter ATP-binding protein [unclassified Microbacterium]PQZ59149.1 ABC transporter ATP-binding protein [Microbacterium sp. MYb43]PQZ81241.1 ABC transporter ATP-binding protein [Microbacterium sp. MYb40]PRB21756.1 ABC transporter ATP-binding protein [Microbacterium sp. MYb54]PRB31515.1 ABC transporter ATP-binding protein [Microbacterium sp. MYb50]PRB68393.1 ABC transporter ATP-binding protein [Microbacterium sp. MYb24]
MSDLTSTAALLPIASSARVRAVVGALLRQHPGRTTAVAVLFLAASALGIVMPACLGRIVDAVSSDAGFAIIAGWVAGAGLGAIGAAVMMLWAVRVLTGLVQDMLASLREDVFASAMRLPVSSVDDGESADLLSRVTGDVDAVAEAGGNVAPTLLSAAFAIGVSVVALAALDPWLALAGIASAPFYVLGTRAFLRKSRVVFREVRVREAARSQAVLDAVEGIETLTAFNEQEPALERVRERAEASIQMQIEGVRVTNRLFRWINGGELVGLAAILGTGFLLQSAGAITVGAVTTAALLFHRLFGPVGQLIFGLNDIQRAAIGLARLVGVIDLAPAASAAPGAGADAAARVSTGIEVRDLTFLYPTTGRGISGVNLQVDRGTTAALVGTSGSGKSTLARVIAGHHPPTSGSVHLTSNDIAPYYLSQELHQFRGTIADNLRLVAPEASDHEMVAALQAVGAQWAIDAMLREETAAAEEDSSADPVVPLDEGRIQQLAVARAFLADPDVVILDEATADVGLHHREAVETAISALRTGRTALLIAHRLQQAVTAEQIVVFAEGRATQRGTHEELLATDGLYRDSWLAQTRSSPHPQHPTDRSPTTETETP